MLTEGRHYALLQLTKKAQTGREISVEACKAGVMRTHGSGAMEWADKHLFWLRRQGFAELSGERREGSRIHRVTEAGRSALAEAEGET